MPLNGDRNTPQYMGDIREQPVGAATRIFAGALLMRNAAGFIVRGAVATGGFGVGIAEQPVDNTAGANGALSVTGTGGGGDMTLDNPVLAVGQQVTVTAFTLTAGGA